ncbi:MAG: hypothetical protein D6722_02095 [Bacteroidetes bacterium]|nr:MAG: hypothetical protein D6722_02095 [Bacteroidota bacterium]
MMIRHLLYGLLLLSLFSACSAGRKIRPDGLSYARLGAGMPKEGRRRWRGKDVRDTLFLEEGFAWRAVVLQYPGGKVYVESDFLGQETINRIRIESPQLHFRELRVGSTVAELMATFPEWEVTDIPSFERLDLMPLAQPSLHFLLARPETIPARVKDIDPQARVVAIVVM